ncbi:DUF6843 domain-containing protein [Paenibacillus camelliae]|uniref:DUF6843 domain-containing protein n=1 Tax=Paenibacillus camelliae TaxID=512410 RepID=UPI00203FD22D|nr:hypothetical protein [Paenibacillus camelliae]MCM3633057.1 hypothetical protein [Paenibacillus camelliae]
MKRYIFAALFFMVAAVVFLFATVNKNPLHIYLVPEHFTGEVVVTFNQTDSQPLAKEKNSFVYSIPDSGKLSTSSALESGPVEVYFVDSQGQRIKVDQEILHGVASTHGGDRETISKFFIGTREQYEAYVNQQ